jgi:branched-chain amino acid aminotransferase
MNNANRQGAGPVWIDGELIAPERANTSVLAHSLHYGTGVFEGLRSYGGKIFENERHMARLINSARLLGYELPHSARELCQAAEALFKAANVSDTYIRPFGWLGPEDIDIPGTNNVPHVGIALWHLPDYYGAGGDIPSVTLTRGKWIRPDPDMMPLQSKAAGNYVAASLNRQFAKARGFSDCVVLDRNGHAVEATVANIFMVKHGLLITPPPVFCLNGITRQYVLQLARELGIESAERDIRFSDLLEADEVFLSGTVVEVTPVVQVDDVRYDIGPVARDLWRAYGKLVGKS